VIPLFFFDQQDTYTVEIVNAADMVCTWPRRSLNPPELGFMLRLCSFLRVLGLGVLSGVRENVVG
jgi:hypothetical protein